MLEYFLSFLILTGALLTFIGSLGLVRLRDLYTRLHGPTKATTLGVGCLLIASSIYFSTYTENVSLHEVLITLFLFITAPVSAHLLAKAALHLNLHSIAKTPENDAEAESEVVDNTEKTDSAGNMESTKSAGFETTKDNPQQAPDQIRQ
jgi:multicomponent K+:H+ antiporter subunit G